MSMELVLRVADLEGFGGYGAIGLEVLFLRDWVRFGVWEGWGCGKKDDGSEGLMSVRESERETEVGGRCWCWGVKGG